MLSTLWKYRHLTDPTATLRYTGKSDSAPGGKWAIHSDPKINMALWNALGVAGVTIPTTAVAALLANKYWDKWLDKKIHERSISKINALRPQMSPNDDLDYTYNITNNPKAELLEILSRSEELSKKASSEESDTEGSWTKNALTRVTAGALPLVAAPAAAYFTVRAIQKAHERKLRSRILAERVRIRNLQDQVDHQILVEQGLVKDASDLTAEEAERIWDAHGKGKDRESVVATALSLPVSVLLGLSAVGGAVAFKKLRDSDKYVRRLEYMKDHVLGSNTLQDSPKISLAKYDKNTKLLARPGEAKTLLLTAEDDAVEDKRSVREDKAKKLLDSTGLVEITDSDVAEAKKDALF